ncbi:MAG: DUF58 domain-containing protein [Bacteroidales bacterium]|nr:DUF58 domain-containing protein [Bacteroidales bacterium]MDG2080271.1 DUF58 domain-containing protein [Bacteroidales bacterium]|tara:strand:+ start:11625 stop:12560 length:936 start_codon:yes stop_codon:yes gene_type:complete
MSRNLDHNRIQQMSSFEMLANQVVEGTITGLHKSPFHGFSVEFAEHRQYNSGESTRHIDWKLFGRTDKMFVKRFEEETNLRCRLIIDCSSSMYFPKMNEPSFDNPNKIVFSIYAAAALMSLMKKQRDATGLSLFTDTINLHSRAKSNSVHIKYLYGELEKLLDQKLFNEDQKTDIPSSLHTIAEMIHKRSLVIIFSDMFDDYDSADNLFQALQHFRHYNHEVILFHVVDKKLEEELQLEDRPYRLVDMENGEQLRINPSEIREKYAEISAKSQHELEMKCGRYNIDYVRADINEGFEGIILPYLLKRKKLH